jgi:inositol-pentakisphosphate 2-kinase
MLLVEEWQYKCEGIGNIILTYTGKQQEYKGHVLRIRKKSSFEDKMSINNDTQNYVFEYVNKVMERLIGSSCVKSGRLIQLEPEFAREFLSQLEKKIQEYRPKHRLEGDPIDLDAKTVLMLPDLTIVKNMGSEKSPITFCVEIKPKWGVLCRSHLIREEHLPIKFNYCRYCMHQVLKEKQGKIRVKSRFCPIDLYSKDRARTLHALKQLVYYPQNNFRVYINGLLYWHADMIKGDSAIKPDDETNYMKDQLQELLMKHNFCGFSEGRNTSDIIDRFLETIYHCLKDSAVLRSLQQVQLLDLYDVEIINTILEQLLEEYTMDELHTMLFPFHDNEAFEAAMKDLLKELNRLDVEQLTSDFQCNRFVKGEKISLQIFKSSHVAFNENIIQECKGNKELALHVIRMFLVAQCAKDCSIMIAFHSENQQHYELGIVDLDPKVVKKIPHYYQLDQTIANLFHQTLHQNSLSLGSNSTQSTKPEMGTKKRDLLLL